jgi:hypothetical protein
VIIPFHIGADLFNVFYVAAHKKAPDKIAGEGEDSVAAGFHYVTVNVDFQANEKSSILLLDRVIARHLGIPDDVVGVHLSPSPGNSSNLRALSDKLILL